MRPNFGTEGLGFADNTGFGGMEDLAKARTDELFLPQLTQVEMNLLM